MHQHRGGGGEEHAELIGPKATATRAAEVEPVEEFFDPIFNVATPAVHLLVDEPGRLPQIGDHKAGIVARLAAREADDFGFDHHAALMRPGPGGIARLGVAAAPSFA